MKSVYRLVANPCRVLRFSLICHLIFICLSHMSSAQDVAEDFFESEIRPILVANCQKCHGAGKQFGDLRLDSREAVLKGGDSGPAVISGNADQSRLIEAVRHSAELKMPPDRKLPPGQIAALEKWVALGVPWPDSQPSHIDPATAHQTHWAFQKITTPPVPHVIDEEWCLNPVDHFILAKLRDAKLSPSPRADRRTLIRRVTYDLTGLPPSEAEVVDFERDTSPDPYSKVVDRLLRSPQYGEQWARHWLDVARYSDTKGYVYGREERVWVHAPTYRDWVVEAFNRDLPYNQFLLLQIAADQAAPNDKAALAAMGFLTLGRRFLGVTHDIIDDRIDVVTRGTMGLTVACARCHDHKYDPIPTADYYSLYGIFMNATERLSAIAEPVARGDAYSAFEKELDQRQQKLRETLLVKRSEAADRTRQRVSEYLVAQTELSKYPEEGFDQILAVTDVIPAIVRRWEAWIARSDKVVDPVFLPWRRFATIPADGFASQSAGVVQELAEPGITVNRRVLQALTPPPASMRDVAERYGRLLLEVDREWKSLTETDKESGLPAPTGFDSRDSEQLRQVLYGVDSPCVVPDEPVVTIESFFDSATCTELWRLQGEVDRWLIQSPVAPPYALSLVDRASLRPSRIFRRGNPANRGPEVTRHFVSVVAGPRPNPFSVGSGRLELAQAIIDPANPLTARVWVNRVWQHHFGTGLVRTPSDFGVRAEQPSHPELLDWLASHFMAQGWSTKELDRLIVLSNTYQQQSDPPVDSTAFERANQLDPENRLLSRMTVRRLKFEEFRDSLLAVSGRLDLQPGGRGSDIFSANGTQHRRRTLYGLIDRQFLPSALRIFDFANPDLHTPARSETTVPQQALFALNHPFVAGQARSLVQIAQKGSDETAAIRRLYQAIYQREPTAEETRGALAFLNATSEEDAIAPRPESLAWQYGYGELDVSSKRLTSFHPLPYSSGNAWQGGEQWPDATLGWVQLTRRGGHPGNDLQHCCVRRWIAPHDGTFSVASTVIHSAEPGNGIRCWILSSRDGVLGSLEAHHQTKPMNVPSTTLNKGDILDFVVDINADLNNDQFEWAPTIRDLSPTAGPTASVPSVWDAERDFSGPVPAQLSRWEQFAQVLLISNEFLFID